MAKSLKWIGIAFVVLMVASWIVRQPLLDRAVVRTLERELGGSIELSSVSISLLRSQLSLDHLVLINPRDFPTEAEFHIRSIEVDYRLFGLRRDPVPLRRVELDVERVIMPFDVEALMQLRGTTVRDMRRPRAPREPSPSAASQYDGPTSDAVVLKSSDQMPVAPRTMRRSVFIDNLIFRLGEIVMIMDYPEGEHIPIVLNLEQHLVDVDRVDHLALSIAHALTLYQ